MTRSGFQVEFEPVMLLAERSVQTPALRNFLRAQRANLLVFAGRLDDGIALAMLAEQPGVDELTKLRNVSPLGAGWICMGKLDSAAALSGDMLEPAFRHRDDLPEALQWVVTIHLSSLVMAGRLDDADAFVDLIQSASAAAGGGSPETAGYLAWSRGLVALERGQVRTAQRLLREGMTLFRQTAVFSHLPYPLSFLTEACALTGDERAASAAVEEAEALVPRIAVYEGLVRRAQAWAAYARGQRSLATSLMIEAADWAGSHGQTYAEMRALHDALRFHQDRGVAARLAEVAASVEGPFARALHAIGVAIADNDAAAMETVAATLEEIGAMLHASEAATTAAAMFAEAGLQSRSSRASAHAMTAAAACEGARSPMLEQLDPAVPLTARENEVARLAAEGLTAREISERLFISARTAEGHLQRAYTKLGVRDRKGLQRLLGATARTGRS
jgi:ATP/maltotriose-dependent transcriptional regulator MalT